MNTEVYEKRGDLSRRRVKKFKIKTMGQFKLKVVRKDIDDVVSIREFTNDLVIFDL